MPPYCSEAPQIVVFGDNQGYITGVITGFPAEHQVMKTVIRFGNEAATFGATPAMAMNFRYDRVTKWWKAAASCLSSFVDSMARSIRWKNTPSSGRDADRHG